MPPAAAAAVIIGRDRRVGGRARTDIWNEAYVSVRYAAKVWDLCRHAVATISCIQLTKYYELGLWAVG